MKEACIRLIKIQYKAMGETAKNIYNSDGGKEVRLHVSMIGVSAFKNSVKETVPNAIEALREGLDGINATVFTRQNFKYWTYGQCITRQYLDK